MRVEGNLVVAKALECVARARGCLEGDLPKKDREMNPQSKFPDKGFLAQNQDDCLYDEWGFAPRAQLLRNP